MRVYEDPDPNKSYYSGRTGPDESYNAGRRGPDVRSRRSLKKKKDKYKASRTYKDSYDQ